MPNRALAPPPGSWDASGLGDKVFGHRDTLMWQFEMGSTIDRGGGGGRGFLVYTPDVEQTPFVYVYKPAACRAVSSSRNLRY